MQYLEQIATALILAAPVACIAWTFTHEEIFRGLRQRIAAHQGRRQDSSWRKSMAYMLTCEYCFSHYVAALFVALFDFKMVTHDWRGYVVGLFTIVLIANVYLTFYQLLRVALRRSKAMADRAEALAAQRTTRVQRSVESGAGRSVVKQMSPDAAAKSQWGNGSRTGSGLRAGRSDTLRTR